MQHSRVAPLRLDTGRYERFYVRDSFWGPYWDMLPSDFSAMGLGDEFSHVYACTRRRYPCPVVQQCRHGH